MIFLELVYTAQFFWQYLLSPNSCLKISMFCKNVKTGLYTTFF